MANAKVEGFDATGAIDASLAAFQGSTGEGGKVRNQFAVNDAWENTTEQYISFYSSQPPFNFNYTMPKFPEVGGVNIEERTFSLNFTVGLRWDKFAVSVMQNFLTQIENGISAIKFPDIKKRFANWPAMDTRNSRNTLFTGPDNFIYRIKANVVNSRMEVLTGTPIEISLNAGLFYEDGKIYANCDQEQAVAINNIPYDSDKVTNDLYIKIESLQVNGVEVMATEGAGIIKIQLVNSMPPKQAPASAVEELYKKLEVAAEKAKADAEKSKDYVEKVQAKAARARNRALRSKANVTQRLFALGGQIGTALTAPWVVLNVHGTVAPLRFLFVDIGVDFGFVHGNRSRKDVKYHSFNPYLHLNYFHTFSIKFPISVYAGLGAGYMLAYYKSNSENRNVNVFTMDFDAGLLFGKKRHYLSLEWTGRTNFKAINHKIVAGYLFRF
jgi:hypothetical protein